MVSLNPLANKERMKIPRQHMPEQDAHERAHNFKEVNLGLPTERAKQEALRCIECAKPTCVTECPVGVKVREFIDLVLAEDYLGAAAKIREDNALPAITGRVCPQEDQCEGACVLNKKGDSLAIGYLERFVADYEQKSGKLGLPPIAKRLERKLRSWAAGLRDSPARATSSKRDMRSAFSKHYTNWAACWFMASPSFACRVRSCARKFITCVTWALSSKPTSSSARP